MKEVVHAHQKETLQTGHPFEALKAHHKAIWIGFSSFCIGIILAFVSSHLPVEEAAKRMTTRIFAPLLTLNYPKDGQDTITVLSIDDTDLNSYDLVWPVPLDFYQRKIDSIVVHQPKAIFLDILFLDNRSDTNAIEKLRDSTCKASNEGIPVFLATLELPPALSGSESTTHPTASNVERILLRAKNRMDSPCVIPVLANISPDKLDQSQWQYPLTQPGAADRQSVALAIYCHIYAQQCPEHTHVPQALIWGTRAAATNAQTMVTKDVNGQLAATCRPRWHWWEALPGASMAVEWASHETTLPLCPYHQVVPLRAFGGYGFSPEELHTALNGKIVMIGVDLAALGDQVTSPFHGRIPGVHVHAMALDNLIATQGHYYENGEFGLHEGWINKTNIFVLLAVVLISFAIASLELHRKIYATPLKTKKSIATPHIAPTNLKRRLHPLFWISALIPSLLGSPKNNAAFTSNATKLRVISLLCYGLLSTALLTLGLFCLRQGPLVIIEYVLFPLMAHFSHLGEIFAKRFYLWWASLRTEDPWGYVVKINSLNRGESH